MYRSITSSLSVTGRFACLRGGLVNITAMFVVLTGSAFAQDSFEIRNFTSSGGGGISSGGGFTVTGSIGQAAVEPIQGGDFQLLSGYLATESIFDSADFNCDGLVDGQDLAVLLTNWGNCPDMIPGCLGDITLDGFIDSADLAELLNDWN
jgi:hypothetical protein